MEAELETLHETGISKNMISSPKRSLKKKRSVPYGLSFANINNLKETPSVKFIEEDG